MEIIATPFAFSFYPDMQLALRILTLHIKKAGLVNIIKSMSPTGKYPSRGIVAIGSFAKSNHIVWE
jgi:hypothetical protein